ncbi:hypothetical protein PIB30_099759 [Stylosanthes scabra]|uniref:Uncharacterized protein n=1 Tax=Stylosanthes scabra TaxID=79078 RepID=A0ABU6RXL8_9FABA|nr:hypothetical protein [Stylosanthes scabra]
MHRETHNGGTYPVNRASDNVGLRMGTEVIFYEELADDMNETWDVFDSIFRDKSRIRAYPNAEPFCHLVQSVHFDPDFPYDYPISSMHPDGGILHPSPPPKPYYSLIVGFANPRSRQVYRIVSSNIPQ